MTQGSPAGTDPLAHLPSALTGSSHPLTTAFFSLFRDHLPVLLTANSRRLRDEQTYPESGQPRRDGPAPRPHAEHSPAFRPYSLAQLLVATTLNHLRRAFAPWLGSYRRPLGRPGSSYPQPLLQHHHHYHHHHSPLDGLRLALSSPDVFLAEALGCDRYFQQYPHHPHYYYYPHRACYHDNGGLSGLSSSSRWWWWWWWWWWWCKTALVPPLLVAYGQKAAFDAVLGRGQDEGLLVLLLGLWAGQRRGEAEVRERTGARGGAEAGADVRVEAGAQAGTKGVERAQKGNEATAARRGSSRPGNDVATVARLVWALATAEYVVGRSMDAAAWLVAGCRLLAAGEAGRAALRDVLRSASGPGLLLAVWPLVHYLAAGLLPLTWLSLRRAARGEPGLLIALSVAVWVVGALIKYRSTIYIALEVSDMFVFLGFLVGGLVARDLGACQMRATDWGRFARLGSTASGMVCPRQEDASRGKRSLNRSDRCVAGDESKGETGELKVS